MRSNQKGFICDLTLFGWLAVLFCISFFVFFVLTMVSSVKEVSDADSEKLKNVNEAILLVKNKPYEAELRKVIKPYLEDNRITNSEADEILKQYEIIQLKYNTTVIKH